MNLNLTSAFSLVTENKVNTNHRKSLDYNTIIKLALFIGLTVLILISNSYLEYGVSIIGVGIANYIFIYCIDLTLIDLHFDGDDIGLNDIINDLWD